jgi:hypothetical protein
VELGVVCCCRHCALWEQLEFMFVIHG